MASSLLALLVVIVVHCIVHASASGANPTAGFLKVDLTDGNFQGHDYSSGVWQFQGYGYVPSGTSGVSVMQIHNEEGAEHSTVLMLHVYDGVLRFYSGQAVEGNIYDRWFRLNVVHDVDRSTVAVYIDGEKKFATDVTPSRSYYFKFGVYMQHHNWSPCMESHWTNVTVYTKP
nr:citrate-binding protein-like [Lolium perenne]